jgi:hypothetical protein
MQTIDAGLRPPCFPASTCYLHLVLLLVTQGIGAPVSCSSYMRLSVCGFVRFMHVMYKNHWRNPSIAMHCIEIIRRVLLNYLQIKYVRTVPCLHT